MKVREKKALFTLLLVLVVVILASVLFGAASLTPRQVAYSMMNKVLGYFVSNATVDAIVWDIRLPRIVLAAVVGLMLSTSGVILQGILRNPLADPYILGISAGASIGAMLSFLLGLNIIFYGFNTTPLFAFAFALIAVLIVYQLSHIGGRTSPETLILSGVAVSAFAAALIALIIIMSGDLRAIYFWLLGSFSGASWVDVLSVAPYAIIGLVVAFFYAKDLNALLLGEEMAFTLGVDVEFVRIFLLAVSSLMAAAAVSVCGIVGFVGLIVPHFVRRIIGPNHRMLIPAAAISGMLLVVIADTIARVAVAPTEIPVGIVMALIGAPFFVYILRKRRGGVR